MVPIIKIELGKPLKNIEIILPKAKPNIKKIFESIAAFQQVGFKIPKIQKEANAKYNPIMALKTFASSIVFMVISKNKSGLNPYIKDTGTTMTTEIKRESV